MTPIVSVELLSKQYKSGILKGGGTTKALSDVSFDLFAGEIVALLGPNGAGKTTLIKTLLGLVFPTGGRFFMFGKEGIDESAKANIGYLPESFQVKRSITARKLLKLMGTMSNINGSLLNNKIKECLGTVELLKDADTKVTTFSKGMMQRLGLAQAFLANPKLLILDEPTDGLDPVGRIKVRETLLQMKKSNRTILLSSHLLSEVELLADRVLFLHQGVLVRQGTTSELLGENQTFRIHVNNTFPVGAGWRFDRELNGGSYLVSGAEKLESLLAALRAQETQVESITPLKNSLEEVFIQVFGATNQN
jgi:ABC-2 type transport system ATP-binding protein